MFNEIILAFVPLFFAMDPVGILPIFSALTLGLEDKAKKSIMIQSLVTASAVAVGFIFFGRWVFKFLGISMGDFMVAGGVILCCLSILDLCGRSKKSTVSSDDVGAVPIGTPLIVGPGVLTMCLILQSQFGALVTVSAVFLNIALVGLVLAFSGFFMRIIGKSVANALSKVLALLLVAIGVMMIRRGLMEMFTPN